MSADISLLKKVVTRPLLPSLIKQRDGSKRDGKVEKLNYVTGSVVVDMVNEASGFLKSWTIVNSWVQPSAPTTYNGTTQPQNGVAHVHGRITLYVPKQDGGYLELTSDGFGSQPINGGQAAQEHIFKSAARDAFKVAASYFGIGLELYRDEVEQAIFETYNIESPWSDEEMAKHAEERNYLAQVQAEYAWSQEQMDALVFDYSNGQIPNADGIVPDNITSFVDWIKAGLAAQTSEKAS